MFKHKLRLINFRLRLRDEKTSKGARRYRTVSYCNVFGGIFKKNRPFPEADLNMLRTNSSITYGISRNITLRCFIRENRAEKIEIATKR